MRLREGEARQAGRERAEAGGGQRLYIPAVLIHHVTARSIASEKERAEGGEVWGRAAGPL